MNSAAARFTWFYSLAQLKIKYRFTTLGFAWNFLEPMLYLIVLSVVFSVINKMNISDYAVYLFSALVPWRYFEKAVNTGMDSIVGGEWALKKMSVSPFAFPLSRWVVATVEFVFSLLIVFLLFAFIKQSWSFHIVVLPLAILPWAALALGVGMICAVMYTFFRDIRPIVQMVLMLAFFSAPILFSHDLFPAGSFQADLIAWHPFTYFAALFQKPIYYGTLPDVMDWYVSCILAIVTLALGWSLVDKYKGKFFFYL
jgi:lipopolysaccharide transport system permease protein